jgi:hypothetical protein
MFLCHDKTDVSVKEHFLWCSIDIFGYLLVCHDILSVLPRKLSCRETYCVPTAGWTGKFKFVYISVALFTGNINAVYGYSSFILCRKTQNVAKWQPSEIHLELVMCPFKGIGLTFSMWDVLVACLTHKHKTVIFILRFNICNERKIYLTVTIRRIGCFKSSVHVD